MLRWGLLLLIASCSLLNVNAKSTAAMIYSIAKFSFVLNPQITALPLVLLYELALAVEPPVFPFTLDSI